MADWTARLRRTKVVESQRTALPAGEKSLYEGHGFRAPFHGEFSPSGT